MVVIAVAVLTVAVVYSGSNCFSQSKGKGRRSSCLGLKCHVEIFGNSPPQSSWQGFCRHLAIRSKLHQNTMDWHKIKLSHVLQMKVNAQKHY